MEAAEKDEKGDKESPLLQIDPKCLQDALRTFFQPIKTNDPRVDFYTMYKREATEHDADYVKKYDEDLNTTLIFAGLFSAVSSAFVIDVRSNLQSDPDTQSAALLRAILLTLNQSAIPDQTAVIPPAQEGPPGSIVAVTSLMYASLLISLLAAFIAMLGKQWLNRYLRNSGGSMIERCGDRQRKCDGLEKWPLHFFVESLPVMLQVALLLLACGLCQHMWSINTFVAYTLISLTGIGVVFYVAIVIAGTSSYACPFQTPVSIALRRPWKKVWGGVLSSIVYFKKALSRTHLIRNRGVQPLSHRQPFPTIPLENVQVQQSEPWLNLKDLDAIRRTNTNDVLCVSWILRNITDPEALDAAIRLAGVIWWFEDGINVDPAYDLIASTFEACFDSTGRLYPGSRDRAYYSGRAMLWIYTLAMCKSEEFASAFLLPTTEDTDPGLDPDLRHLLHVDMAWSADLRFIRLLNVNSHLGRTPSHSQWISNVLLHLSWANRTTLDFDLILDYVSNTDETTIPLNVRLNRLLVWCIFLGSPFEEEALKVQDKSDRMERILYQLSKAVVSAINGTHTQRKFIPHVLRDLIGLETRPVLLSKIVYEWCSAICENRQSFEDPESLLLVCLEIGFRHLDPQESRLQARLTHTEYHRELVDVVFKSQNGEAIADLLHACTIETDSFEPARTLLGICAGNIVGLHNLGPFSPRLRRLVIRSVELIGCEGFEGAGVERFVELLNQLHVTVEDMDDVFKWAELLLGILQTYEGVQCLSHWYWELLVELAILESQWLRHSLIYGSQIMTFLAEAHEWSKLECWMGIVWMVWPPGADGMSEGDLYRLMVLLFQHRPGAAQKLEQWMERWSQEDSMDIPESFRRTCTQAREATQGDAPPISLADEGSEELAYPLPPVRSSPSRGNEFWESLPHHVF